MARQPNANPLLEAAEPPRDGEFFFEEGWGDEQLGGEDRGLLERHPFLSLGFAAALGTMAAALLLRL